MVSHAWFVGANINGEDQTERFIKEGIWINQSDKMRDKVLEMQPGDKIAIKAAYVQKYNVPFENYDKPVSTMSIKAIDTITHNNGDGKEIKVDWQICLPEKKWYFYTHRKAVWEVKVNDHDWRPGKLLAFTFLDEPQPIERFLQHPFWKDHYQPDEQQTYKWTKFYEEMAYKLLHYERNRPELISFLHNMYEKLNMPNPLYETTESGKRVPLHDICPFTVFGLFNKGMTTENRKRIAEELAQFLQLKSDVPESFSGIPILNNLMTFFFMPDASRDERDIERLWKLFRIAIHFADRDNDEKDFISAYNRILEQKGIRWNITIGLFWIRPWTYVPLDNNTRNYLTESLQLFPTLPKRPFSGEQYVSLLDQLTELFQSEMIDIYSYPELSERAWLGATNVEKEVATTEDLEEIVRNKYDKENLLREVFLEEHEVSTILNLLKRKKNIILEGPPGVGKTFVAERIAYSLLGKKDNTNILSVQFHPSYAYEDFVIGYRPDQNGFVLREGPFYTLCKRAEADKENDYFVIIDEINRGNIAKIFGELLMLIEHDKRGKKVTLTYTDEPFSIPENVYIIGTMNTADRSLALIDYALRRRFSFFFMKPAFQRESFKDHLRTQEAPQTIIDRIVENMETLNERIRRDVQLGSGFEIGHSFFCHYEQSDNWYEEIITYEIAPLLREYWFDDIELVDDIVADLLRS